MKHIVIKNEDLAGSKEKDYKDSVYATGGVAGEIFGTNVKFLKKHG